MMKPAVELKSVSEKYTLYSHKVDTLKEKFLGGFSFGRGEARDFWALSDIDMCINEGEVVGIIGENGSGKTTLLKLIAGILKPDKGEIDIHGSVSAILQLGVGFQRDLTGRENVYLNSAMLGIEPSEIDKRIDNIIEFAELQDFIDMPLKTYSSGMEMRLGFSIAVNVDPDILLIDEVLIIGDEAFQKKCMRVIDDFKSRNKTIIIVSHSMDLIQELCDRTFLLRDGKLIFEGHTPEVISYYYTCSGEKRGIADLYSEELQLIFNNGRSYLFNKKQPLFTEPGLHFVFEEDGRTYYSFHAYWSLVERTPEMIRMRGELRSLGRVFELEIRTADNGFCFCLRCEDETVLPMVFPTLRLRSCFEEWFCGMEKGSFSFEDSNRSSLRHSFSVNLNEQHRAGVFSPDEPDCGGIMMSFSDKGIMLHSNTGENRAVPQVEFRPTPDLRRSISLTLKSFQSNDVPNSYLSELYEKKSLVSSDLRLFIDEKNRVVRLSKGGVTLTEGTGIGLSLDLPSGRLSSENMEWKTDKISDSEIDLIFSSEVDDLKLRLALVLEDDSLSWKVIDYKGPESGAASFSFAGLILDYDKASLPFCDIELPPVNNSTGWKDVLREKDEFIVMKSSGDPQPQIIFDAGDSDSSLSIINVNDYSSMRALRFNSSENHFRGRLSFIENDFLCDLRSFCLFALLAVLMHDLIRSSVLKEDISIVYSGHSLLIMNDGRILTHLGGLRAAFTINGVRCEIGSDEWSLSGDVKNELSLSAIRNGVEILVSFRIDGDLFVDVALNGKYELADSEISLMFMDTYSKWKTLETEGVFPVPDLADSRFPVLIDAADNVTWLALMSPGILPDIFFSEFDNCFAYPLRETDSSVNIATGICLESSLRKSAGRFSARLSIEDQGAAFFSALPFFQLIDILILFSGHACFCGDNAVVFADGRIFLLRNGELICNDMGIDFNFRRDNADVFSLSNCNKTFRTSANSLEMDVFVNDSRVLTLCFCLSADDIFMQISSDEYLYDIELLVPLSTEIDTWKTEFDIGSVLLTQDEGQWQELNITDSDNVVLKGLSGESLSDVFFPVAGENTDLSFHSGADCLLLRGVPDNDSKVIETYLSFASRVEADAIFEAALCLHLIAVLELFASRRIVKGQDEWFFSDDSLSLVHNDRSVFCGCGFSFSVVYKGRTLKFLPDQLPLTIRASDQFSVEINADDGVNLGVMIFRFDERGMVVCFEADNAERAHMHSCAFELYLSPEYENWFVNGRRGRFSEHSAEYEWQQLHFDEVDSVSGVLFLFHDSGRDAICLESQKNTCDVFNVNSDPRSKAVVTKFEAVDGEIMKMSFESRAMLDDLMETAACMEAIMILLEMKSAFWELGQYCGFVKGAGLSIAKGNDFVTVGEGLYLAYQKNGIWNSLNIKNWDAIRIESDAVFLRKNIEQQITVDIVLRQRESVLSFDLRADIEGGIEISGMQAGIVTGDYLKDWFASGFSGRAEGSADDDISRFVLPGESASFIYDEAQKIVCGLSSDKEAEVSLLVSADERQTVFLRTFSLSDNSGDLRIEFMASEDIGKWMELYWSLSLFAAFDQVLETSLHSDPFMLFFDGDALRLMYLDEELTMGDGIHFIGMKGIEFNKFRIDTCEKISDDEFRLSCSDSESGQQKLRLLFDDNQLRINIDETSGIDALQVNADLCFYPEAVFSDEGQILLSPDSSTDILSLASETESSLRVKTNISHWLEITKAHSDWDALNFIKSGEREPGIRLEFINKDESTGILPLFGFRAEHDIELSKETESTLFANNRDIWLRAEKNTLCLYKDGALVFKNNLIALHCDGISENESDFSLEKRTDSFVWEKIFPGTDGRYKSKFSFRDNSLCVDLEISGDILKRDSLSIELFADAYLKEWFAANMEGEFSSDVDSLSSSVITDFFAVSSLDRKIAATIESVSQRRTLSAVYRRSDFDSSVNIISLRGLDLKNCDDKACFSIRIDLPEEDDFNQRLYNEKQNYFVGTDDCNARFLGRALQFYSKERSFLCRDGIFSIFEYNGVEYHSLQARSETISCGNDRMEIRYYYDFGQEIRTLSLRNERLAVSVFFEADERITDYRLCFEVDDFYSQVSIAEAQESSVIDRRAVIHAQKKGNYYLVFEDEQTSLALGGGFSPGQNSWYELDNEKGSVKRTVKFGLDGRFPESALMVELISSRDKSDLFYSDSIRSSNSGLFFVNDGVRANWKDLPVLKNAGMQTIYQTEDGLWHDSVNQARRELFRQSEDLLIKTIYWQSLPLIQKWEIRRVNADEFHVKVLNEISGEVRFSKQHLDISLRPDYDHWGYSEKKGAFPSDFRDGEWSLLHIGDDYKDSYKLISSETDLPDVSVSFKPGIAELAHQVMNSGEQECSRLVQCCRDIPETKYSGEYLFLEFVFGMDGKNR